MGQAQSAAAYEAHCMNCRLYCMLIVCTPTRLTFNSRGHGAAHGTDTSQREVQGNFRSETANIRNAYRAVIPFIP